MPLRVSILPTLADGWSGRPAVALVGSREPATHRGTVRDGQVVETTNVMADAVITTRFELTRRGRAAARRHTVRTTVTARSRVDGGRRRRSPFPTARAEVLDFSGRWARERRAAAAPPRPGHLVARDPGTVAPATTTPSSGRGHARLRLPRRRGLGDPRRVERRQRRQWLERSPLGPTLARRRRAARRRASSPRPGETYAAPTVVRDVVGRRPRRPVRPAAPVDPVVVDDPLAAAGDAQHVGGRVLRPLPRAPRAAGRRARPRSASSASCSTTAGSAAAPTTAARSATGSSTRTGGPTGCSR